ncbi:MAG: hypothetical protein F6K19_43830 [Cyanothece sp. SIO1E1]|nr:hypothetical protein [Cyanothece sp. SIO1E1]
MTDTPYANPEFGPDSGSEIDADVTQILQMLRRKEQTWVEWGRACQHLQKNGYSPQSIFEETGFEPIQQNQVIVAAQVYASLENGAAPEPVLDYFRQRRSDILYEFRILAHADRVSAATLATENQLDVDAAHDVAKAIKEFSRFSQPPTGFTTAPGDAIAYQCWRLARQKSDLQERSRLIARGLRFAHSDSARLQMEKLLTDFTVVQSRPQPRLPTYRLESEEELPRVIPVIGQLPLTKADLQAVPLIQEEGSFNMVKFTGTGAWVPVPGWQVILKAEDPVGIFCQSHELPIDRVGKSEDLLLIIDRAQRDWDGDSYFLVEPAEHLAIQWYPEAPEHPLLGRVILVMRPKKILDRSLSRDPWQIDE